MVNSPHLKSPMYANVNMARSVWSELGEESPSVMACAIEFMDSYWKVTGQVWLVQLHGTFDHMLDKTVLSELYGSLFAEEICTYQINFHVGDITHHYNHNNNHNTLTFW